MQSDTLDRQPNKRFNLQLKFRAIGVLLLSLWLETRFYISTSKYDIGGEDYMTRYKQILRKIPGKFKYLLDGQHGK